MKREIFSPMIIITLLFAVVIAILLGYRFYTEGYPTKDQITHRSEIAQSGKVNINTATVRELNMLPGIGYTIARRIVSYREKYGPFTKIEDICKVKGIGKTVYISIRDYITV